MMQDSWSGCEEPAVTTKAHHVAGAAFLFGSGHSLALVNSSLISREKDTAKQKIPIRLPPQSIVFNVHQIESTS